MYDFIDKCRENAIDLELSLYRLKKEKNNEKMREELYNEVKDFLKYIYKQLNELSPTIKTGEETIIGGKDEDVLNIIHDFYNFINNNLTLNTLDIDIEALYNLFVFDIIKSSEESEKKKVENLLPQAIGIVIEHCNRTRRCFDEYFSAGELMENLNVDKNTATLLIKLLHDKTVLLNNRISGNIERLEMIRTSIDEPNTDYVVPTDGYYARNLQTPFVLTELSPKDCAVADSDRNIGQSAINEVADKFENRELISINGTTNPQGVDR